MRSELEIEEELEITRQMADGASRDAKLMLEAQIDQLEWVLNGTDD